MDNALSAIAILISIVTAVWAYTIERRLQRQADARSAFDSLVAGPVESRLAQLEAIFGEFNACVIEAVPADRSAAVSRLVKLRYNPWFFGFVAFLQASSVVDLSSIEAELYHYHDEIAALLNEAGDPASSDVELANKAASLSARTIATLRAQVQEARLKY